MGEKKVMKTLPWVLGVLFALGAHLTLALPEKDQAEL